MSFSPAIFDVPLAASTDVGLMNMKVLAVNNYLCSVWSVSLVKASKLIYKIGRKTFILLF